MMKDSSMGVRAGLNRANAEFEPAAFGGIAHTRSSRLATVISKIARQATPFGARRLAAPDPLAPTDGARCLSTAPHPRKGLFSPVGERRIVAIPEGGASPRFRRYAPA